MRFVLCLVAAAILACEARAQERDPGPPTPDIPEFNKDDPITYFVPEGLTTPDHLRFERASQSGPYCGPNCLYLLLRLKNFPVEYKELVSKLDIKPQGCSLAELQELAQVCGLPCEVRKVSLKELEQLEPPFILHLTTPAGASQDPSAGRDHFVVATRREPAGGSLVGVDPSSGNKTAWSEAYLSRNFSGYVLTPRVSPAKRSDVIALGVLFGLLTAGNLVLALWKPKRG
jgi:hypothetical protein